ncbi:hypothetical protein CNEONATC25_03265 [Clostridium neonatale]|nr:hypothetical protein CNEONATC25_03265 [Clostridium neonatale]
MIFSKIPSKKFIKHASSSSTDRFISSRFFIYNICFKYLLDIIYSISFKIFVFPVPFSPLKHIILYLSLFSKILLNFFSIIFNSSSRPIISKLNFGLFMPLSINTVYSAFNLLLTYLIKSVIVHILFNVFIYPKNFLISFISVKSELRSSSEKISLNKLIISFILFNSFENSSLLYKLYGNSFKFIGELYRFIFFNSFCKIFFSFILILLFLSTIILISFIFILS